MISLTQPVTTTQMRRDPKSLLKRVQKEKIVPILAGSRLVAAVISVEELESIFEEIDFLKKERFAEETLRYDEQYKREGGSGPFGIDELAEHLKKLAQ